MLEALHRREDGDRVLEKRLERDGEPEQPHGEHGVPRAVHQEWHREVDRPGQSPQHELQRRGRPPALGDRARVACHRARQDHRDPEVEDDPEDGGERVREGELAELARAEHARRGDDEDERPEARGLAQDLQGRVARDALRAAGRADHAAAAR